MMAQDRTRTQPSERRTSFILAAACAFICAVLLAAFFAHAAFAIGPSSSKGASSASSERATGVQAQAVQQIKYGGDKLWFCKSDLESELGMFSNPDKDMSVAWEGGKIHVTFTPKNRNVFIGFYLGYSIDDVNDAMKKAGVDKVNYPVSGFNDALWIGAKGESGSFTYDFELDSSYGGYAWPIAPIQAADKDNTTTSEQYYLAVPPLEKISGYTAQVTVIFTDGNGTELSRQELAPGEDATPPADPTREGFIFDGWDKDYTNITEDTTITAQWVEEGKTYYTVTFENGEGSVIKRVKVEEGAAVTPPDDPEREGYTFTGWKPDSFGKITADLTAVAQWVNNDELTLEAMREALAALPSDPKKLLGKSFNKKLTAAATAYNALSDELKAQLTDDERLHLAMCAIIALPSDPFDITIDHKDAVYQAQDIYDSLPADLQKTLDSTNASSGRSYGRYLENGMWGFDSLRKVNNITLLKEGTYTGQVKSSSSMGKSSSQRGLTFTVKSVTVKSGYATAIIEHSSNSSESLRMGGVEYKNLQTDSAGRSYFEIPINLNSTFHFAIKGKGATKSTDAITYEMTVSANEATMTPDPPKSDDDDANAKAAKAVASQINLLPSAKDIAVADAAKLVAYEASIQVARKAYNALTDEQKALVDPAVVKVLEGAEEALANAKKAQGDEPSSSSSSSNDDGKNKGSDDKDKGNDDATDDEKDESKSSSSSSPIAGPFDSDESGGSQNGGNGGSPNVVSPKGIVTPTGVAGNLSALTASTQRSATGASTSSSGAPLSATSTADYARSTLEKSVSTSATTGGAKGSAAQELATENSSGPALAVGIDLSPAIAGVLLLLASLGSLMFALRFVRRESLAA